MNTYTLSEVLGAAYIKGADMFLVHAVTDEGKAACGEVKAEHLAEYVQPGIQKPTCKKCLKLWEAA